MAAMIFELSIALLWPAVLFAAVWAIAAYALSEKDQISKVVETLTQRIGSVETDPSDVSKVKAKR